MAKAPTPTVANKMGTAIGTAAGSAANGLLNAIQGPATVFGVGLAAQALANATARKDQLTGITNVLGFPLDAPKYYMDIYVSDYMRQSPMQIGQLNIQNYVRLPLPLQINDQMEVAYEEKPLGAAGGAALEGAGGSRPSMTTSSQPMGTAQAGMLSAAQGLLSGNERATDAARLSGYSPNQFMVILLKGPKYKRYTLSWKLAAKTPEESEVIRKIILLFNKSMAPNLAGLGGSLFSFPKVFQMAYRPNFKQLYRFKPAVLENFSVNYAGGDMPMFYAKTQAPESVEIKMQFQEIEYWLGVDFVDDPPALGGYAAPGATTSGLVQTNNAGTIQETTNGPRGDF